MGLVSVSEGSRWGGRVDAKATREWQIQCLLPYRHRTGPGPTAAADRLSPGRRQSTQQQQRLVVHAPPGTPPFTPAAAYSSPSFPVRKRPSSAVVRR